MTHKLAGVHTSASNRLGKPRPSFYRQLTADPPITTSYRRASDIWWIQSVYVRPDCRRRGHFRALYAHVREECRRAGACGLRLYADTGNERAHAAVGSGECSCEYRVACAFSAPMGVLRRWGPGA